MKRLSIITSLTVILLGISSCAAGPNEVGGIGIEYERLAYATPVNKLTLTTEEEELVSKGNVFATDYLSRVNASTDGDFIISPLSLQFLLGMLDDAKVNTFYRKLQTQLSLLDKAATLVIANTDDNVDPNAPTRLMNEMSFKSQWSFGLGFPKADTREEMFTLEDGTKKTVATMMMSRAMLQCQGNDVFTAVRLPFGNLSYSITVIRPEEGHTVSEAVKSLCDLGWQDFSRNMVSCVADIWLPKFKTDFTIKLRDILSQMGLSYYFDSSVDISGSSDIISISLSQVLQKVSIAIDEEGAEASATSTYITSGGSGSSISSNSINPANKIVFHADRPFIYIISEWSSGAILFAGKYSGI